MNQITSPKKQRCITVIVDDNELETRQGNLSGMLFVLGRMAFQEGKSIFDCPYSVGSKKEGVWMDGFMFAEKQAKNEN
jgi:hypothetical protein